LLASALAKSRRVMDLHAESIEDNTDDSSNNVLSKRLFSVSMLSKSTLSEKRQMARRYELISALNKLESDAAAASSRFSSWEEAKEQLASVLQFPSYEQSTAAAHGVDSDDIVNKYMERFKNIKLDSIDADLRSVKLQWERIALAKLAPSLKRKEDVSKSEQYLLDQVHEAYKEQDQRLASKAEERVEAEILQQEREKEAQAQASALMRPFTAEELDTIKRAMNHPGSDDQIIAQSDTDSIQRGSLRRLLPNTWLNDEVIHYFLVVLTKRDEEMCAKDPSRRRCHFFKSFFMTKLLNEGHHDPKMDGKYDYKNVKRWSKKVPGKDIFKLDKIVFPINQGSMHWVCVVAYMQEKRIQFYDSLGGAGKHYLQAIFQYIKDEHQDKRGAPLFDADQWSLVTCTDDTPRQLNGKCASYEVK
jgi:Ulp1 family protease